MHDRAPITVIVAFLEVIAKSGRGDRPVPATHRTHDEALASLSAWDAWAGNDGAIGGVTPHGFGVHELGPRNHVVARPALLRAQRDALLAYADENGHGWKQKLAIDWSFARARLRGEHSPELQQVRNKLGPSWLASVTREQIEAAPVR
jgi:hypothetical protein